MSKILLIFVGLSFIFLFGNTPKTDINKTELMNPIHKSIYQPYIKNEFLLKHNRDDCEDLSYIECLQEVECEWDEDECEEIEEENEDESHNSGQNCLNCHYNGGPGEDEFIIGGTIYTDPQGTEILPGVNVIIEDAIQNIFFFNSSPEYGNIWFDAEEYEVECDDIPMDLCIELDQCIWEFDDNECEDNELQVQLPIPPYSITVEYNGYSATMPVLAENGDCNSCHIDGMRIHVPTTLDPVYELGDINMDDVINILDVVVLVNSILGTDQLDEDQFQLADINEDEDINILDIVLMVDIILGENEPDEMSYSLEIQPIFNSYCTSCHGNSAGLNLTSYNNVMDGSYNGAVIMPFSHSASELWQRINFGQMPPGDNNLTQAQINLIAQWIDEGALNN